MVSSPNGEVRFAKEPYRRMAPFHKKSRERGPTHLGHLHSSACRGCIAAFGRMRVVGCIKLGKS